MTTTLSQPSRTSRRRPFRARHLSLLFLTGSTRAQRIAVIGGGVSGTFFTKYLTDFEQSCDLNQITLFDPIPPGTIIHTQVASTNSTSRTKPSLQQSRVATLELEDGNIIELGASYFNEHFRYIGEMATDGNLTLEPMFPTTPVKEGKTSGEGLLIHNGNPNLILYKEASLNSQTILNSRYSYDWPIFARHLQGVLHQFATLHDQISDESDKYIFHSSIEVWKSVGLDHAANESIADLCQRLSIYPEPSWWKGILGWEYGSFYQEFLSAINRVNFNQDNSKVNALAGLLSFSNIVGDAVRIVGGNAQLLGTAWKQAHENLSRKCDPETSRLSLLHEAEQVSTIVGSLEGFELYSKGGSFIGHYDIVVLAAPLSMANIDFLVKSHIDESVLQPMPLGGLVPNADHGGNSARIPSDHEGHSPLPRQLSKAATRPYVPMVTTIVRNAVLNKEYFRFGESEFSAKIMYMAFSEETDDYGVASVEMVSPESGLLRVLSSKTLSKDALQKLFGKEVQLAFEQEWSGREGGAVPDFQGRGETTEFLLFDGATGFHGHTKAGALYYPNAIELSASNLESSAIGAKTVAKLVAHRLDWIRVADTEFGMGDEL